MNGFGRLIGNENKKVVKQTGLCVILIIIAVLTALSPVLGFVIKISTSRDYTEYLYNTDNLDEFIREAEENGDKLSAAYYGIYRSTVEFFTDNDINSEWQIDAFRTDYTQRLGTLRALELIDSGSFTADQVYNSPLNSFIYRLMYETNYTIDDTFDTVDTVDTDDVDNTYENDLNDPAVVKKLLAEALAALDELQKNILSFSLADYYDQGLAKAQSNRDIYADELEKYRDGTIKAHESNNAQLDGDYQKYYTEVAELNLEAAELKLWCWKQLRENLWAYGSWQYLTVASRSGPLESLPSQSTSCVAMAENVFIDSGVVDRYGSYNDYLKSVTKNASLVSAARDEVRYSLENGIPIKGMYPDSTKDEFISVFTTSSGMLIIFTIILAGMTLSNEYTSGTVRLLLIRPRSRAKILASKLLSVFIWWIGATVVAALMLALECMLFFGIGDIFMPDICVIGGKVLSVPSFVMLAWRILLTILSAAPIVMFALLISTLIKKAALPIALSMMARFGTSMATTIAVLVNSKLPRAHLEYTPLPYLDLTKFIGSPVELFVQSSDFDIGDIFGTMSGYSMMASGPYSLAVGVIWMVALAAIMTVLSFVSFGKQQIKS